MGAALGYAHAMLRQLLLMLTVLPLCAQAVAEPTYAEPVAGILHRHCAACHREDGGAPFPLLTYRDAQRRAGMIAEVVANGLMPPWKAAPGELRYAHERRLADAERAALMAWAEAGAPEGDPAAAPPAPVFSSEWHHGPPDILLEMEEDFPIPAEGGDIYRNFVVRIPDLPPGKYLRGVDYKPRAVRTAHHALFAIDSTGDFRRADEREALPGFGGMDANLMGGRIAGWAVGAMPDFFPDGVAVEVPPGSDLVIFAHFHPTGKAEVERARIALYLGDRPPVRQMYPLEVPFGFGITANLDIPAGAKDHVLESSFVLPEDVLVSGITPHAHMIAREISAEAEFPGGRKLMLLHVKDWDFAWQEQYKLAEMLPLPKGTRITSRFLYDNSAANPSNPHSPPQRVRWGPESTDEMACVTLRVVTDDPAVMARLKAGYGDWVKDSIRHTNFSLIAGAVGAQERGRRDLNADGKVSWDERWASLQRTIRLIRGDPRDELGLVPFIFRMVTFERVAPIVVPCALVLTAIALLFRRRRKAVAHRAPANAGAS